MQFEAMSEAARFPLSVVLVDDDPDELVLLRRTLVKAGIADTIRMFDDAREAVEYLGSVSRAPSLEPPRLVALCDLKMPHLDGFGFLERIRASDFSAEVRIIIVSGCALESDVEKARLLGADGYLEKMSSVEMLRSCINTPTFAAVGSRPQLFESWEESRLKLVKQ